MPTVITNGNTNLSCVCTMTLADPCVVTFKTNGRSQTEGRAITFSTDGALPATITAGTTYYVRNPSGDDFNLSATVDGALLDTSGDSQSGTHKVSNAFLRVEAANPGWGDAVGGLAVATYGSSTETTPRTIAVTFANAGACQGVGFAFFLQTYVTTNNKTIYAWLDQTLWSCTVTAASPCVVQKTGHGFTGSEGVSFVGTLPTGLTAGITYYVKAVDADTFNLSATPGGANINTTGSNQTPTLWAVRASTTKTTTSIILSSVYADTGAWVIPFLWDVPYSVTTDAATYRFRVYATGPSQGGAVYLYTSDGTNPTYFTWCDTGVTFTTNDCVIVKDYCIIDQTCGVKAQAACTGSAYVSSAGISCTNLTDASADNVSLLEWMNPPDASYTLTINGGFYLSAHGGFRAGTSTDRIPIAQKGTVSIVAASYGNASFTGFVTPLYLGGYSSNNKSSFFVYGERPTYERTTLEADAAASQKVIVTTDVTGWPTTGTPYLAIGKRDSKSNADRTWHYIASVAGDGKTITLDTNLTIKALAGATVALLNGYGFSITGTSVYWNIYIQAPTNFQVDGCYLNGIHLCLGIATMATFSDDAPYESAWLVTHCGVYLYYFWYSLLSAINVPTLGMTVSYCNFFITNAFNRMDLSPSTSRCVPGTFTFTENFLYGADTTYSQPILNPTYPWVFTNNTFNNVYLYGASIVLQGINPIMTGNVFYGNFTSFSNEGIFTVRNLSGFDATIGSNTYDRTGNIVFYFAAYSQNGVISSSDSFGPTVANDKDMEFCTSGGGYTDWEFASPINTITPSETYRGSTVPGTNLKITSNGGTTNNDQGYLTYGKFQRTGYGLADTTVWNGSAWAAAAAGQFALRMRPTNSTTALVYEDNGGTTTIGDCQNLPTSVSARVKINSATYYAGTHTNPTLSVTYDGSTTVTAVATDTTDGQQLQVNFTPTTTNQFISILISGATDATGTDADFYVGEILVLKSEGVMIDTTRLAGWSHALPLGTTRTFQAPASVWDELLTSHTTSGTFGAFVAKLLTVAKFLGLK